MCVAGLFNYSSPLALAEGEKKKKTRKKKKREKRKED